MLLRALSIILLLAGAGFLIYGATLPNNPPDLIIGGVIFMVGLSVCCVLGFICLLFSVLSSKRD